MIGLLNNLNLNIMLKNILKLEGVQELNKTEQKNIAGSGGVLLDCYRSCRRRNSDSVCKRRCWSN
jgi:hypothetical protein